MRDIVASLLPGWDKTRAWIIARPMTGFAETFAQYAVEVAPGGGSTAPEPESGAQAGIFIANGTANITINSATHTLGPGSYAYIPPGAAWQIHTSSDAL